MGFDERERRSDSKKVRRSDSRSPDPRRKSSDKFNGRGTSPHLSKFYRERFGDESPEHYNNLRISNFDSRLNKEDVKDILEKEFREYKNFEIKIVRHDGDTECFAYVNFDETGVAKDIRRTKIPILKKVLGSRVCLDPTGVVRDQEGKYIPDRYNRSLMDRRERSPPEREREKERERERERRRSPPPRRSSPPKSRNESPTRTIFIGNMPASTNERDIKNVIERYGKIECIEIKMAENGLASYAFINLVSIREAVAARHGLDGLKMGREERRCRVGFGKSQPSRRVWVGDLGSWCTREMLEREFDRIGSLEEVEYKDGDEYGYVVFNETQAGVDAVSAKNLMIKGHKLTVDFAKVVADRRRRRSETPDSPPPKKPRGPRTPSPTKSIDSPVSVYREKSENGNRNGSPKISTLSELQRLKVSTWKGIVMLKKSEYPVNLHRIFGDEDIIQDYLRDSEGRATKLTLSQRLPMDDALFDKITSFAESDIAVAFAVEKDRPIENLLNYLGEKKAAGVVSSDKVQTYLLGNSTVTQRIIGHFASEIDIAPSQRHFLVVIKKV